MVKYQYPFYYINKKKVHNHWLNTFSCFYKIKSAELINNCFSIMIFAKFNFPMSLIFKKIKFGQIYI